MNLSLLIVVFWWNLFREGLFGSSRVCDLSSKASSGPSARGEEETGGRDRTGEPADPLDPCLDLHEFLHERKEDGRALRLLAILDAYTRECLALDVARRMSHRDVMDR